MNAKKFLSLSLAAVIAISSTGCAGLQPKGTAKQFEKPKDLENFQKQLDFIRQSTDSYKPIEVIEVSEFFIKSDNLNQELPEVQIEVSFNENTTLEDFGKVLGFPVKVDDSISKRKIGFKGNLKGDAKYILNTVSTLTNTYWTYEENVILFQRTKNIVYNFPFFSMERINSVYNAGANGQDPTNVNIKDDVFNEIKVALMAVLDEDSFGGQINEQWNERVGYRDTDIHSNAVRNDSENGENRSRIDSLNDKNQQNTDNTVSTNTNNSKDNRSENSTGSVLENKGGKNKKGGSSGKKDGGGEEASTLEIKPILSDTNNINNSNSFRDSNANQNQKIKEKVDTKTTTNEFNDKSLVIGTDQKDKKLENELEQVQVKTANFTTTFSGSASRISMSKEVGAIFAKVTPSEERKITKIIEGIVKKSFNNMVIMDTYILEVNKEKTKTYGVEFSALIQSGLLQTNLGFGAGGLSASRDNLMLRERLLNGGTGFTNTSYTPTSGQVISSVLKYFIGDSSGEILSQPKIITLPNLPARIKDSKFHPYIEPSQITDTNANAVSYQLKNVEEGIDLTVLPSVFSDDTMMLSIGININQYLGDKQIVAGVAGSFNLPQQAPKKLNTTFRIKPGDVVVLGGIKSSKKNGTESSNLMVPTDETKLVGESDFVIVAMPRLLKFVQKK